MSDPEGLSINTSPRSYRKASWAALAVLAILVLVVLVALMTIYSADENIIRNQNTAHSANENTIRNQNTAVKTVMCDRYAAVDGSDYAEGTKAAPFNTAQRLVASLSAGQVGCLRGGIYTDKQLVFKKGGTSDANRVTLRSYPGETAELRGSINVPEGSNFISVSNMRLDGSYSLVGEGHDDKGVPRGDRNTEQAINLMGDHVNVHDNDITNRRPNGDPDLAGTCMILGSEGSRTIAEDTSIRGNRIHHCGQLPRINREHGIYLSAARDTMLVGNFIHDNADRGVQLYPNAQRTLIEDNVIDSNAQNIVFGGSGNNVSSDNIVRNNVVSNSRAGWNVSGNWNRTGKVGSDNEVYDNCVWSSNEQPNGGIAPEEDGFDAYENLITEPAHADTNAGNFEFGDDSPCKAILDKQSGGLLQDLISSLLLVGP